MENSIVNNETFAIHLRNKKQSCNFKQKHCIPSLTFYIMLIWAQPTVAWLKNICKKTRFIILSELFIEVCKCLSFGTRDCKAFFYLYANSVDIVQSMFSIPFVPLSDV